MRTDAKEGKESCGVEFDVNHRIGGHARGSIAPSQLFRREGITFDPDKPKSRASTVNVLTRC